MDPVIDNEWLGCKNDPIDEPPTFGNIARSWQWRERGVNAPNSPSNKTVLENVAEDVLVQKPLKIRCCDLPGYPRSTFLMVFSPDGTKVASTHGNHNVYVSELASGKHVRILKGHPRTPWCIAFHPSHPQLIGSGCLAGQVRVWDISSGGSEVWNVRNETVIASIAFHPRVQLLVIATYNELYFWDWSQPAPMTKVSTNNINEKVRYVAFDSLGYKLITGISLSAIRGGVDATVLQHAPSNPQNNSNRSLHPDDNDGSNRPDTAGATQDVIVNSYQYLVQRYDSLVRNYQRLFMVRNRLAVTPPPNTTDRGTDPMETDPAPEANSYTRTARSYTATTQLDDENQNSNTSNSNTAEDTADAAEEGSSGLLNLDALSFDRAPPGERNMSRLELAIFGARPSAFHPLTNENPGRSFRTVDQNERASRLLPNPFSNTNGTPRPSRVSFASSPLTQQSNNDNAPNASRTSIFTSYRPNSPSVLDLSSRRWSGNRRVFIPRPSDSQPSNSNSSTRSRQEDASSNTTNRNTATNTSASSNSNSIPNVSLSNNSLSNGNTPTDTTPPTNNSTRRTSSPPQGSPVDAQTINESLDLIRDILRDSGTRLLNLITNMSASSLPHVGPEVPNRRVNIRAHSDDSGESERPRGARPRVRLFSSNLQPEILSSSSESDSDQSSEVNILRTPNTTFREEDSREESSRTTEMPGPSNRSAPPSDRADSENDDNTPNTGIDTESVSTAASASSSRNRPRTQNNDAGEGPSTSSHASDEPENLAQNSSNYFDSSRPSTSGNNIWTNGATVPPEEAFRKVRGGVNALQKHTTQLTNMWVRGNRTTMRELRTMWENLRRRIIMLHRETGRQDLPNYYTRSLLERCMMLTEMTGEASRNATRNYRSQSNMSSYEPRPSTSRAVPEDNRPSLSGRSPSKKTPQRSLSSLLSKRLQAAYCRWRPEDRRRNPISSRMSQRYLHRPRREYTRLIEISATRHEIRMRAMQVLSVMFNMMMLCLEERGLSSLIINMLRTLKKALALTCLMLMTNRYNPRSNNNDSPQRVDSMNVIRLQNVDHTGPVNVDGPDESPHHSISSETEEDRQNNPNKRLKRDRSSSTTQSVATENPATDDTTPPTAPASQEPTQRWSNRLAVQIAAANRNTSMTARTRRDLYVESKRQKALHRTNPLAHPLIKKKVLPPVSTYRIPSLRLTPRRLSVRNSASRANPANGEPIAGPSGILSGTGTVRGGPSRLPPEMSNEFEHRINLIRMAHMQAVRLRNAARSRFRRLQTIRLYTPSSVREMFTLQPEGDNPHESRPLQNNSEPNRRSLTSYDYRPHILTRERIFSRGAANRPSEDSGQFHAVISNTGMPLMQVSDLSISNQDGQGNQNQRLPRIHEYLQPIILAQNAMVVDEERGEDGPGGLGAARRMGGMAGLLDAGIISEALPASSHRVQAWDFTTGDTPDISNTTKNVVVQRCRIHNDASIDISKDGRLLVALLPVPRLRNANHWLGVYSLEWSRLGQCLHTAVLEQNAVSVALSPTARHLAVGLGSRRFTSAAHSRNNVFALLYRLDPLENSSRTGLSPIKELEQTWEHGFTSLNCLRWAPQPGQGLVYANNTGQLIIMS
ncbi:activating molecule in BECN1-regulated autophagy protein 1-like [Danaus plexippus]|uniref:activating molecule in BECN1-regulated autophagy protein 1-like n=1 Tax=Danaus plexippus TaxID=13037 RepID=UPI002AB2C721|nr:activating molecule in BECN1-regulated autophagy protein 1-like [Danaus plexippus]